MHYTVSKENEKDQTWNCKSRNHHNKSNKLHCYKIAILLSFTYSIIVRNFVFPKHPAQKNLHTRHLIKLWLIFSFCLNQLFFDFLVFYFLLLSDLSILIDYLKLVFNSFFKDVVFHFIHDIHLLGFWNIFVVRHF